MGGRDFQGRFQCASVEERCSGSCFVVKDVGGEFLTLCFAVAKFAHDLRVGCFLEHLGLDQSHRYMVGDKGHVVPFLPVLILFARVYLLCCYDTLQYSAGGRSFDG